MPSEEITITHKERRIHIFPDGEDGYVVRANEKALTDLLNSKSGTDVMRHMPNPIS